MSENDKNVEEKKITSITLEIDDVEYTLEYNRDAVKRMERMGFNLNDVDSKILTSIDFMVEGAFYKNHPTLKKERLAELRDYIIDNYDVYDLMSALTEMLSNVLPKTNTENDKVNFKVFIINRG